MLAEVLDLFLLPDYNVVSTTYLDHLLSHIAENTKECKEVLRFDASLLRYISCDLILQVPQSIMNIARSSRNGYQGL